MSVSDQLLSGTMLVTGKLHRVRKVHAAGTLTVCANGAFSPVSGSESVVLGPAPAPRGFAKGTVATPMPRATW